MKIFKSLAVLLPLILAATDPAPADSATTDENKPAADHNEHAAWNYVQNGADWASLAIDGNVCGGTN